VIRTYDVAGSLRVVQSHFGKVPLETARVGKFTKTTPNYPQHPADLSRLVHAVASSRLSARLCGPSARLSGLCGALLSDPRPRRCCRSAAHACACAASGVVAEVATNRAAHNAPRVARALRANSHGAVRWNVPASALLASATSDKQGHKLCELVRGSQQAVAALGLSDRGARRWEGFGEGL
jgi:hypothetical protein